MNEVETHRIAAAVNALRPDWPFASLLTLLNKPALTSRHRRDVAVALTWVACDSATKTPARVLEAGPWWTAVADAEGGAPRIHWLDRCVICNYGEATCVRVNAEDHPFRSHRQAASDRPRQRMPMPEEIRELVCAKPAPDHRPFVPPTPETPAERVQGEAGEVGGMSACLVPWFYGEYVDHIYRDCMNRRKDYVGDYNEPAVSLFDAHGTDVCGMCLHRHNRTTHAAHLAAQRPTPAPTEES